MNPKKDGFNSGIYIGKNEINLSDAFVNEDEPGKALECLSDFYSIKIDSTEITSDFYFYIHPNNQERGVQTMLEIEDLSKGKHTIFVQRKKLDENDEMENVDYFRIVFWKE